MSKRPTLPSKPSDLAELALRDMRKAIGSPHYHINMRVFHKPNKTCAVCVAGAVMAFTLGVPHNEYLGPGDFPEYIRGKLYAIDCLRSGAVGAAFFDLGRSQEKGEKFDRRIAPYKERNRKPFFQDMRALIKDLRAAGC